MFTEKRAKIVGWLKRAAESPYGLSLSVTDTAARKLLLNAVKTVRDEIPEYRASLTIVNAENNELWICPRNLGEKNGTSRGPDETYDVPSDW